MIRTNFLLLLVALMLAAVARAEEAECGGHGKRHGSHCHCERGYKSKGLDCVPVDAAASEKSCPVGGISWIASSVLYLEKGGYTIELVNNTEPMATLLLPLDNATEATAEALDASLERATNLVQDITLPRKVVKADQEIAPSAKLLYIIQRNNADELAQLKAECDETPGSVWHIDHCDGPDGHDHRRLAVAVMHVNVTISETALYALHLQHDATKEFGMRILTRTGDAVVSRVETTKPSDGSATETDENPTPSRKPRKASATVWLKTMAAVAVTAALAIIGLFLLMMRENSLKRLMDALVALSAGALFGASFIHILPEAIEFYDPYGQMNLAMSMIFTAGFAGAMMIEMMLEVFIASTVRDGEQLHGHHGHPVLSPRSSVLQLLSPAQQSITKASSPTETDDSTSKLSLSVEWQRIKPMAYIILLGDLFHNFVDGVLIATAFLACDDALGISVTLSVILHEVPQEICDFIILIDSGFTSFQAIFFNFMSALSAFIGATIILSAVEVTRESMGLLLGFGAGTLTYIAATDLLPRALRVTSFRDFFTHVLLFGFGIGLLALTTLYHVHCDVE